MFSYLKFRRFLSFLLALFVIFSPLKGFSDPADDILAAVKSQYNEEEDEGYIINFTDVAITEYIRFVSKILGINFIFDDAELQFKTTIVSEEPISGKNVLSTLLQVLRIHNLHLIEQNNNLLITTNTAVAEIGHVVADNIPGSSEIKAPLVTRIFFIKNTNAESIAEVIRPMLSKAALLEVMRPSNQLIVSDVVSSVEQVAEILVSLDSAQTPLEVDTYECKNISPENLIAIAANILEPFREGKVLTLVPQMETNSIFIVSTNALIERTMSILQDLDSVSQAKIGTHLSKDKVFVYKIVNQTPQFILNSLLQISEQMEQTKHAAPDLLETLSSVRWIKDSNSLMFIGDSTSVEKVKEILAKIDTDQPDLSKKGVTKERVYIYKIQKKSPEFLLKSIKQIATEMESTEHTSPDLLNTLSNVRWIKDSNSLMFIGDEETIAKIQEILANIDSSTPSLGAPGFFLFPLKTANKEQVEFWLNQLADNLASSSSPDEELIHTIRSMKWIQETNSLLFNGNEYSLNRLKELLSSYDFSKQVTPESPHFWTYRPKHHSGEEIEAHVKEITANLKDSGLTNTGLLNALKSMRWSAKANALTFTGDEPSLARIKTIVETYDITGKDAMSHEDETAKLSSSFFIYKPKVKSPEEITQALAEITNDLKASQLIDPVLMRTLQNRQFVDSTQSFLFSGSQDSLEKVESILARIDIPKEQAVSIQQIGKETFLIYKTEFVSPAQLISSLQAISSDLSKSENVDKALIKAIGSAQVIKETNSLLFIGSKPILEQIEMLAKRFDIPSLSKGGEAVEREAPSNYILYVPKYQTGPELIVMLSEFKAHLVEIGMIDKPLFDTIDHLKWVDKSKAILISGTPKSIAKVEELLARFDEPVKGASGPTTIQTLETTSFLVYKLQYHKGSAIQEALKMIAKELSSKDTSANKEILDAIQSLQWIHLTNSLVGTGNQHALEKLKELIRNLDLPLKQVFFEVLIIRTTLANTQDFGLQWGSKFQYLNKFAGATGNFPPPAVSGSPVSSTIDLQSGINKLAAKTYSSTGQATALPVTPKAADVPFSTSGFDLGIIGDILLHRGKSFISLGSLVSALQTDADTTIILNPKIITQDNNNSTLFVGQNIPFVGSSVTNTSTNTLATTNLEYRDVGLNLSITPTLSTTEIVTIDIQTDISEKIGTESFGDSGVQGITTSHTSMNTRVTVPNRHFLILSGMLNDDKEHSRAQIPCLGGLPLLGAAFSQNIRQDTKQNILIFLKPYIINSFDEYKALTEDQEVLLKEEAGLPIVAEEIDAGLEWVKGNDNH